MKKIRFLPARELRPEDIIVHKGRKLTVIAVGKLFTFVQIKARRRIGSAEVELVLHGRRKTFVIREDTHGPIPESLSGLRNGPVLLRTVGPVRFVSGNGTVRHLPRIDTSGPTSADAVRLGFGDPSSASSPADVPTWTSGSGMGWRGTVPFVPQDAAGHQGQVALVSGDRAGGGATARPLGEGGVVPDVPPTIPAQGGPPVGDTRPAERSGYLRMEDLLKSLHSLSL